MLYSSVVKFALAGFAAYGTLIYYSCKMLAAAVFIAKIVLADLTRRGLYRKDFYFEQI